MNARRVEITLSEERWELLERARGHEPRASFIKRALESALSEGSLPPHKETDARAVEGSAASTRTPKKERLSEAESVLSQANWAMERQRKLNERKS